MTLKKREKVLAIVAGAAVLLLAGWFLLYAGDGRSFARLRQDREKLLSDVQKKETRVEAANRAVARLAAWQKRSLPADASIARSLYQQWIRGVAEKAGFRQLNVGSSETAWRTKTATLLKFTVRGRASLGQLVQFLFVFYSAGHLHQITQMDVKPRADSEGLDVEFTAEALSLATADSKDQLSNERGGRLKLASLSDYSEKIVDRNFFAPYAPPPPEREEPSRPKFDPSQYAFVTAIVEERDGRSQVWLMDRTAGKTLKLGEGETFAIGSVKGSIKTIGQCDVVVKIGDEERRLTCGESLRRGGTGGPPEGDESDPRPGFGKPESRGPRPGFGEPGERPEDDPGEPRSPEAGERSPRPTGGFGASRSSGDRPSRYGSSGGSRRGRGGGRSWGGERPSRE
jgi:hypothetical protein